MNQLTFERNDRITLLPNNIHFSVILETLAVPDETKSRML